jgi:hypothetical protein
MELNQQHSTVTARQPDLTDTPTKYISTQFEEKNQPSFGVT